MSEEKRVATVFDISRLCKSRNTCDGCPARPGNYKTCPSDIGKKENEAILKWCDEHPQKTYLQDFFEKFPNAKRSPINSDIPVICRYSLYRIDPNGRNCGERYCASCWNEVMQEEEI